ncbi:hypothetical protein [Bacillus cytotoxicus]|uniref:hypothetical protein n=1 Tax=Bacillus cytotoxicus TaxID=580165 RepID=UPI0013A53F4A|nr:hypothetical protein [Bacillus cytotoxicus]
MKVKVTFEYELEGKQREQFEDVRTEEGEAAAFYFLEDLVKKKLKSLRLLKQSTKNKTKQIILLEKRSKINGEKSTR